jgi:hypothetical protein
MLELIIVILLVLWLLGYFGRGRYRGGNLIHLLLIIVVILIVVRLLR